MGTAKTKRLFEFIKTFIINNTNLPIYIMSFRITFTTDFLTKINTYLTKENINVSFVSYKEIPSNI